jgi:nucleotide-binding universal stress UspA family protein
MTAKVCLVDGRLRKSKMYKHILIATDGSKLAQKAVDQGLGLAKELGAKVSAVLVTEPRAAEIPAEVAIAYPIEVYKKDVAASAAKCLTAVDSAAKKLGVACNTKHLSDQYPAEGIIAYAKDKNCDLIVMASHGRRGIRRLLVGSQAIDVLTHSSVPVLICR